MPYYLCYCCGMFQTKGSSYHHHHLTWDLATWDDWSLAWAKYVVPRWRIFPDRLWCLCCRIIAYCIAQNLHTIVEEIWKAGQYWCYVITLRRTLFDRRGPNRSKDANQLIIAVIWLTLITCWTLTRLNSYECHRINTFTDQYFSPHTVLDIQRQLSIFQAQACSPLTEQLLMPLHCKECTGVPRCQSCPRQPLSSRWSSVHIHLSPCEDTWKCRGTYAGARTDAI